MKALILFMGVLCSLSPLLAQPKKLVVMGSSTAFGTGAQPIDSSWVRRVNYYYKYQVGLVDTVYNIALGGYDPYHGLPSWYTPAPFYSLPDPQRNITKANSLSPDVIIVSFVSNNFQVGGLPTDSIMKALQLIKDSANKEGRVCFISSTQPRTQFDAASRERLKILKDSILNRFGFYAINLFDSLVNPVDNTILPQYASPFDQIHLNNAGHFMVYKQVLAKNIFNITTTRSRKSGNWNDPLTWDKGIVPGPADSVAVLPGHALTLNSNAQIRALSVAAGASLLSLQAGTELQVGQATACNNSVEVSGSLQMSNGKLTIFGRWHQNAGSVFNMTGGELIIDGNSGNALTSVEDGLHLFDISSAINSFAFTGGVLQIVDPPSGSNSQSVSCLFNFGLNSVLKFGNGVSTTAGNQPNGFGGTLLPAQIGQLIIDASIPTNNRHFRNMNPLTVKGGLQVLSGNLIQSALLSIEN